MELWLPPPTAYLQRNPLNGRLLKGHKGLTTGKKWSDFMPIEKQEKIRNVLRTHKNHKSNPVKKRVVAIKNGKIAGVFESLHEAERKLGLSASSISKCCKGKLKSCGKMQWFYETSNEWFRLIEMI